jgi:hypothetical protein
MGFRHFSPSAHSLSLAYASTDLLDPGVRTSALEAAQRLLPTTSAIQREISNVSLYEGAPLYAEVKARMDAWGFRPAVEAIFRVSGNVLFVRSQA